MRLMRIWTKELPEKTEGSSRNIRLCREEKARHTDRWDLRTKERERNQVHLGPERSGVPWTLVIPKTGGSFKVLFILERG